MRKAHSDTNKSFRDFMKVQKEYSQRSKTNGFIPSTSAADDQKYFIEGHEEREELSLNHKRQYEHLPPKGKEIVSMCRAVSKELYEFKNAKRSQFSKGDHSSNDKDLGDYLREHGKTHIGVNRSQQIHKELVAMASSLQGKIHGDNHKFPHPKEPSYEGRTEAPYYIIHSYMKKCIKLTYRIYAAYLHHKSDRSQEESEFLVLYRKAKNLARKLNPKDKSKGKRKGKGKKKRGGKKRE